MSKISLNDIVTPNNVTAVNTNFDKLEAELNDKVLYRKNPAGEPNQMLSNLDMNSNRILNLPEPLSPNEPARLADITGLDVVAGKVEEAINAAATATSAAGIANTYASQAQTAAAQAAQAVEDAQDFAGGLTASSTSVHTLSTGSKLFTIQANKQFNPGQFVIIASLVNPANFMIARVDSYSGAALQVSVSEFEGSGSANAWSVSVSGPRGAAGPRGLTGVGEKGEKGDTGDQGQPGADSQVPGPVGPAGPNVMVKDEGTTLTTSTSSINFVGNGVTATTTGNDVTVTVTQPTGSTPSSTVPLAPTTSGSVGSSTTYARGDHTHPSDAPQGADTLPMANSTAAIGASNKYARQDHVHPNNAPLPATVTPLPDGSATVGTSTRYAREDHVHPPSASGGGDGELEWLGSFQLTAINNAFPEVFGTGSYGSDYDKIIIYISDLKLDSNRAISFAAIVDGTAPVVGNYQLVGINANSTAASTASAILTSGGGFYGYNSKIEIINSNSVYGYPGMITCTAVHKTAATTSRFDFLAWSYAGFPMNGFQINTGVVPLKGFVTVYGIKKRFPSS